MSKEFIYVPAALAAKFNALDTDQAQQECIEKIISNRKLDMQGELSNLDDDLVMFKGALVTYKTKLSEAYDDHQSKMESLVDDMLATRPCFHKEAKKLAEALHPIKQEVAEMKRLADATQNMLNNLNYHAVERMTDLVRTFSALSGKEKDLLGLLLNSEVQNDN